MKYLHKLLSFGCVALLSTGCSPDEEVAMTPASVGSVSDHVTFYGVGKVARYQQHMDSSLEYLGPLFFFRDFYCR